MIGLITLDIGMYRSLPPDRPRVHASRSPAQGEAFAAVGSPYAAYRRASRHRDELDALEFRAKLFEVAQ
jgi:hypothetical protein